MKIAFIISSVEDKLSGPKNSVTLLAKYIAEISNHDISVYSTKAKINFRFNGVVIFPLKDLFIESCDFIILNGIYDLEIMRCAKKAKKINVKYVFIPRSGLMLSSLKKSWYKKIPYLFLNYSIISNSILLFFLTQEEKNGSLFGGHEKSKVCGNIVEYNPCLNTEHRHKIIRFIGRFDVVHKGLDILMHAISLISGEIKKNGWSIHLHGPDHDGGLNLLKNIVKNNNIQDLIVFHSAVHDDEKYRFLSESSIFVHTSRYEGQPQAVMEAMAFGNVILVTHGTNMGSIVNDAGCGYVCDFSPEEVSKFILKIIGLNHCQIKTMQFNSYKYSRENFSGFSAANCFLKHLHCIGLDYAKVNPEK